MKRTLKKYLPLMLICSLCLAVLISAISSSVLAKTQNPFQSISSFEVAALFYKLAEGTPNFSKWAAETDAYQKAETFDKQIVQQQQEDILRKQFYNLSKDKPFSIYFNVHLKDYSSLQQTLFIPEISEETFFPYHYSGEDYAIFLKGLQKYGKLSMNAEEANRFLKKDLKVEFVVFVESADAKAPLTIYKTNYWVMTGKIAEFKIWNADRTIMLYSDKAPWYQPENDLLNLYSGR